MALVSGSSGSESTAGGAVSISIWEWLFGGSGTVVGGARA
jgi:hypothetical protein